MPTWTAKQQIYSYYVLLKKNIKLTDIRILRVLYLLITEIFFSIILLIFNLNPECFVMFYLQALV